MTNQEILMGAKVVVVVMVGMILCRVLFGGETPYEKGLIKLKDFIWGRGFCLVLTDGGGGGLGCDSSPWWELRRGGYTRFCLFAEPMAKVDEYDTGLIVDVSDRADDNDVAALRQICKEFAEKTGISIYLYKGSVFPDLYSQKIVDSANTILSRGGYMERIESVKS